MDSYGYSDSESEDFKQDNEPPKEKLKTQNQFQELGNAISGDMEVTQQKANENNFARIKKVIEECGSVAEVEKASEDNKSQIKQLAKYAPNLFEMLKASKQATIQTLDPEGQDP